MEREELEPVITFACPKCGKKIEMRETEANHLTCKSRFHSHPRYMGEFRRKVPERLPQREVKKMHGEGVEDPQARYQDFKEWWREKKTEEIQQYRESVKKYCMAFESTPSQLYSLVDGLLRLHLPQVFIDVDERYDGKHNLNIALDALMQGRLGIDISVPGSDKRGIRRAYLWKNENRFHGVVEGQHTSWDILVAKDFVDARQFAEKWYR